VALVERDCFGTAAPEAIAVMIDEFLRRLLGAGIAEPRFFVTSTGCVLGASLADGRGVVCKAHQRHLTADAMRSVQSVQRLLAAQGFPAPEPLAGPARLGRSLGTVETLLEAGAVPDACQPTVRAAVAASLHRFFVLTRGCVDDPGLPRRVVPPPDPASVFPRPHSPVFDFAATTAGADWIEALALAAARVVEAAPVEPRVVAHVDWRAEHLRFADGQLVAVYDWDSVRVDREAAAVGQVAQVFTTDWGAAAPHVPTLEESAAFLEDYQAARGAAFTRTEARVARAAWVYGTAYGARCEHALAPTGIAAPTAFRDRLAAHGEEWLR
jgi:Phosphotransferase enzyme family